MARAEAASYRDDALGSAIVDLVRVGVTGHASGVRQLAARLVRNVPDGIEDVSGFRAAVHEAMNARSGTSLRFTSSDIPADADGAHPLVEVDPMPDGGGLILPPGVMAEVQELVQERRRVSELLRSGASLTRTVLLSGPPGVGKTLTSRWLAASSGLPLVSLDLSAVVSSYLGTSGRNIRSVLDYAKSGPCVLLLDEFDAIAKRRDDDTDIGELKRVVNVVLVELDRWPDTSLLVAATNHAHLLDPAVGRRFDRLIELARPGSLERRAMLDERATLIGSVDAAVLDLVAELTEGATGSDIDRLWGLCLRKAVLHGTRVEDELLDQIAWREHDAGPARDMLWSTIQGRLGLSNRQIAARAGVTHPTVSAAIHRARGNRNERGDGVVT